MKKMLICCATLCVTLTLFCVAALATDLKATVEPVDAQTVNVVEKQGGADRVFTVTKNSGVKAGDLYLVLIQKGAKATDKPKPTEKNIYYIDVVPGEDSGLNKEVTPRDMDEGSYAVYLSDWSESGKGAAKGVATITLSAPTPSDPGDSGDSTTPSDPGDSTTPGGSGGDSGDSTTPGGSGGDSDVKYGDVNGDGNINGKDRMILARYVAKSPDYGPDKTDDSHKVILANSDLNLDGNVNGADRMILARYVAKSPAYQNLPIPKK